MKSREVRVLPYDSVWKDEFEKIKREIEPSLSGLILSVEHVGSTAVEGLCAKPCIDLDVIIEDYAVFESVVERLSKLGYIHEGDLGISGREAFAYSDKEHLMTHHLYVCPKDSEELHRHLTFRNFLRKSPDAKARYAEAKMRAAALFPSDINGYMKSKSVCIDELYKECGLTHKS